jgi:pilus assembly protein Flp/PilA
MSGIGRSDASTTTVQRLLDVQCLLDDESGQDLVEYVMLAALLGMVAIASMNNLVNKIGNVFNALVQ